MVTPSVNAWSKLAILAQLMGLRWTRIALVLGLVSLIALWSAWGAYTQRQSQALLARARDEISHQRWGVARTALTEVLRRRPGWDEALYELGVCEEARGRAREANEAWDQVQTGSPWAGWIEVRRALAAMDQGRFEECETLLRSAAARAGTQRAEARWGLVLLAPLGRSASGGETLARGGVRPDEQPRDHPGKALPAGS